MEPLIYKASVLSVTRGLLGISFILILSFIFSSNRKAVSWKIIVAGLSMQLVLAIGVVYIPYIFKIFEFVGSVFIGILDFTKEGSRFVFGPLVDSEKSGYIFAFQILPTIIFFAALCGILYYYGIIQAIVKFLAFLLRKIFKLSGAESLVTASCGFLGQSEAPLLVKSFLNDMTRSEFFMIMTAGMGTLAGGIMAAYIGFLGGTDPVQKLLFAKHLIAASAMAAPGSIVIAKIMEPQTLEFNNHSSISKDSRGSNVLDAISKSTSDGLKLAISVGTILIVFVALTALLNFLTSKLGGVTGLNNYIEHATGGKYHELSMQLILGYIFAPVMWIIGICPSDITYTGQLLGQKIVLTEFIGYINLTELKNLGVFAQQKSVIMSTYFLSGFANFASIGIQIAGLGTLAPNKAVLISKLGLKAMVAGALTSLLSACFIGIFLF